mmetsp:Transcript_14243/g.40955  ORF Transcript_14243/g.40955 Transcript_14243/m.40955 type:complete len:229 (-) Transcript_14243:378-1064(-)
MACGTMGPRAPRSGLGATHAGSPPPTRCAPPRLAQRRGLRRPSQAPAAVAPPPCRRAERHRWSRLRPIGSTTCSRSPSTPTPMRMCRIRRHRPGPVPSPGLLSPAVPRGRPPRHRPQRALAMMMGTGCHDAAARRLSKERRPSRRLSTAKLRRRRRCGSFAAQHACPTRRGARSPPTCRRSLRPTCPNAFRGWRTPRMSCSGRGSRARTPSRRSTPAAPHHHPADHSP